MLYILLFFILAGCFLLGMTWMRIGLFNLSGSSLELWLRNATSTPVKSFIAGIFMTVALQSSSAVTVIAVGLVSARILTFPQTIGIVLGTNIGTTVTLEILSFDLSVIIIPLLAAGTVCLFFRSAKIRSTGFIFMGIGITFASMNGFGWLSSPLTNIDHVHGLIENMEGNIFFAFIMGVFLTAIIQSGTVVTGIAMSFIGSGVFSLETGILIMMGSNIGTCSTALLASIGAGNEARLTAYAHLWLNIIGVLVFLPFIPNLADWSISLTANPETQLAHASVIFNMICSLAILPFARQFGQFILKIHKKKP